ncbi:hypothetical protein HNQ35_000341 [Cerasibacillus quisquiliarum]|uniref:Uncharacterized protein n=1 Tax=Cerasibacillus quisquiliarum TaxID=227865 RepID=A0A511UW30_9BACI|nr:hypothetical protein [Cerasibacillus quisquiliarum]MBB5145152.1 hypothetical protein [Cerasibacillus quisquiliarum]GEN29958.1 hypothetical protein CQU01_01960 [Cerasibacillus quisquiliarum]
MTDDTPKLIPKISFKGVFIFMIILFTGTLFIPKFFLLLALSMRLSYFLAAGISASIGLIFVLTKIDASTAEKHFFKKRIIISIIVGFVTSALITFVFGRDLIG